MPAIVAGLENVLKNLNAFAQRQQAAAESAAQEIADVLTETAKQTHRWHNRTGETEASTEAHVHGLAQGIVEITLSSSTDAAKFLELAHNGEWAWLWPAVLVCEPQIKDILQRKLKASFH